jgi:DNA-binding HxlR family transcriptional regulator
VTGFNHSYEEQILKGLEEHGRLYFNELVRKTGISRSVLDSTLKKLQYAKQIDKEPACRNGKVV